MIAADFYVLGELEDIWAQKYVRLKNEMCQQKEDSNNYAMTCNIVPGWQVSNQQTNELDSDSLQQISIVIFQCKNDLKQSSTTHTQVTERKGTRLNPPQALDWQSEAQPTLTTEAMGTNESELLITMRRLLALEVLLK